MFKRLHIQLTIFCTFVTGLILIGMSLLCLCFSEAESAKGNFSDFQKNVNAFISHMESQSVISHTWLSQFYADTHVKIEIRDNGTPLIFENLKSSASEEEVFKTVRQIAREEHAVLEESVTSSSVLSIHTEFEMTSSGKQDYYAGVAVIPKNGGTLTITFLYPLDEIQQKIIFQRLLFAAADTLGILLLSVFFWLFTAHMIRPLIRNRQKQAEFIASASHELRSPLTVMLSCLSAMKTASPIEAEHFSETIEQEGRRMGRLIDDMLTLSNTDSSHFTIRKTAVELDTLLLSTYEKFEPLARKKNIVMKITLPEDTVPPCLCDEERIAQVLSILVDNAISYTPKQGQISLSLKHDSGKIRLQVSDNGAGIPDTEKEAVFDRFYRCDKSHKDKEHFGLGLCIAREIIRFHKGKLWVENTPGGGASFVLVLGL